LKRARKARKRGQIFHDFYDYSECGIAVSLTREEAHFWLDVMTMPERLSADGKKYVAADPAEAGHDGKIGLEEIQALLLGRLGGAVCTPQLLAPLSILATPAEIAALYLDGCLASGHVELPVQLWSLAGIVRHVLPYASSEELDAMRAVCKKALEKAKLWDAGSIYDYYKLDDEGGQATLALPYLLASVLGFHDELLEVVSSWTVNHVRHSDDRRDPGCQHVVFGLGSPELVEEHMRRLKLRLVSPDQVIAWIAHTGTGSLDFVRDSIAKAKPVLAKELSEAFALVRAKEAAPVMLELRRASKAPKVAVDWLEANVELAKAGLVSVAKGSSLAEDAAEFLKTH
jgi:hypothetical protein